AQVEETTTRITACDHPSVFHCDEHNIQCIPLSLKCDGFIDCNSKMDEAVVTCGCAASQFQCNSTTCISKSLRCDRKSDCDNGSDEENCKAYVCPMSHIKCNNHFCYPRDKQCDFIDDCGDNSDELNCNRIECNPTQFTCNNSQCVETANICDGVFDCVDHSDESEHLCTPDKYYKCSTGFYTKKEYVCDGQFEDCRLTHDDEINCGGCGSDQFQCPNNRCIKKSNVCDGHCDCLDCADEDNCEPNTFGCPRDTRFICLNTAMSPVGIRCISREYLCDLKNDCLDSPSGQDEKFCNNGSSICPKTHPLYCSRKMRCLEESKRCNHYPDCYDGEDELNCPAPTGCKEGMFMCEDGGCIPQSKRCNAVHDCVDWSDELNCEHFSCPPGKRSCSAGHCVPENFWCDFYRDCPDGSDEKSCPVPRPCKEYEFQCKSGQCINSTYICYRSSNRHGCADNSHLINCSNYTCSEDKFKCRSSYCINQSQVCDNKVDCIHTAWDEKHCYYSCPFSSKLCICHGNSMFCNESGLTDVPSLLITEDLTKLNFSINHINLTNATFSPVYFDRVTSLDLSFNSISEIPDKCFQTMWRLTYLNLAGNNLTELRNGSLFGLTELVQLHLNGNKIEHIDDDAFIGQSRLKTLDLGGQRLTHLYKNMFKGLREVTVLNLTRNKIRSIENGAFNSLMNIHTIDLTHNMIRDIGEKVFMGLPTLAKIETDSFTFCCIAPEGVDCSPKQDEFSSCEDLMSNHVLRISIWVLGSVAIIGNFVVIIWRMRDFRGGKVHSFLITNLAIGDFLMGLYMLIIAVADTLYRGVYVTYADVWKQSGFCQFAGFVSTFSSELSVLTLTTITLDRLVCILFPLRRARLGLKQASVVMSFMWFLVFVLAALPLLGFGYFENFYGRSGVCLALHVTPDKRSGWEYSVGVFIVLNFVSFLLIASSYLWMFSVAKKTRSAVRCAESKTDSAMAKRMTLIVMTDFCCWVPIIVLGFISLAGTRADDQVYAWIAVFVLPLNSAMNPVIYTLSTAPFLGNLRKRASRFRKSFIHSFTTDTKHSYVDDGTTHSYCEKKSSYRQLELKRLRSLNNSPPMYYDS
ncbi:G-protein coupled receptor GRL101, partial [Biomphalaria pfeifferi]